MKDIMDDNIPTAKEMNLPEEFVYATRIVNMLSKIDFKKSCDVEESIRMIQKTFIEYKNKLKMINRNSSKKINKKCMNIII